MPLFLSVWIPPLVLLIVATILASPLSSYLAWIMDGKYRPPRFLKKIEDALDSGPQSIKRYGSAMLTFSCLLFIFNYLLLALQPYLPMNPEHKSMLFPSTIFHTAVSFLTNTNLQHYAGEVHLSNFSQIFFCITNFFLSPGAGACAFIATTRALRGDLSVGNFFIDMWRTTIYILLPLTTLIAILLLQQGCPMTFESTIKVRPLETRDQKTKAYPQTIVVGPVAAFEAIKMLGTNGGGFYSTNSAHPFENPTGLSNFINTLSMILLPFSFVFMYGKMLKRQKHSYIIFSVMLSIMIACIIWTIYFDTQPNSAMTAHGQKTYYLSEISPKQNKQQIHIPAIAAFPVDQHLGNLEGKELRFGNSAGACYEAITTCIACGAENAEADSLMPLSGLFPMIGMWLNCIFGGIGSGMMNMLLYIIIGIFIAGMMVGRTPEYLGKKIGEKEVKLVILALLVHPLMILLPTGIFAATTWGQEAISNPGAHGFSQMLYQFSSASANNGSAFGGLDVIFGFFSNKNYSNVAIPWDIATGIIMLLSRYLPIIATMIMASTLGAKHPSPYGLGTLRIDTPTFGWLLFGTIFIVGALLFLPAVALGPLAEHLGPIPFGGY